MMTNKYPTSKLEKRIWLTQKKDAIELRMSQVTNDNIYNSLQRQLNYVNLRLKHY